MKTSIRILVFSALAGGLVSCASVEDKKMNQELDKKVAAQPAATHTGDMAAQAHKMFIEAPGLTEAQKVKLNEILTSTFVEASKIKMEFGKTKGALFEALVSPQSTKKEVDTLKGRLIALDKKRLDIMLQSLFDVEKVIGKSDKNAEYFRRIFSEISNHGEM